MQSSDEDECESNGDLVVHAGTWNQLRTSLRVSALMRSTRLFETCVCSRASKGGNERTGTKGVQGQRLSVHRHMRVSAHRGKAG
jgi:hypothetical protein